MRRLFGAIGRSWGSPWVRWPVIVLALLSLLACIWLGLPLTGVAVFATLWLRATLTAAVLAAIASIWLVRRVRRRRAARALEAQIVAAPVGDADVLAERMQSAVSVLKKARGSTYLYDLPWYVIIGPPGAGKTTALKHSGIDFPSKQADPVEGFGGTRNCDWWFAEEAVLIDTAGRYMTQDSNPEADRASWTAFLDLLKRHRPKQPINGVLLAFPADTLMQADEATLRAHAETIRTRLGELQETLRIDFPVYLLVTKADRISGFMEYFGRLDDRRTNAVWGVTFQTKDRKAETWSEAADEFDALVRRLSDEVTDRMHDEQDLWNRIAVFGLPGQVAMMRDRLVGFLKTIFRQTSFEASATLRGFYFTSGTQEGTAIDQVLGEMGMDAGAGGFLSGTGRSFFLRDLLQRVIFRERDWVSYDFKLLRRMRATRIAALTATVLLTAGALTGFAMGYWNAASDVATARLQAAEYGRAVEAAGVGGVIVDDHDLERVVDPLRILRGMEAGYADARDREFWRYFGLSQYRDLNLASVESYSDGLERLLRPRLMLYLAEELERLSVERQWGDLYRTLKVYLLLGNVTDGGAMTEEHEEAVLAYFAPPSGALADMLPGTVNIERQDEMLAHLRAMLELDDTKEPLVRVESALVEAVRNDIVDLRLAQQAFLVIEARAQQAMPTPLRFVDGVRGGRVSEVFRTRDGAAPLDELSVPMLYTVEGYWGFFLEEVVRARERLRADRWVLGAAADRVDFDRQLLDLEGELHTLYRLAFRDAWAGMLGALQMAPMSVDAPEYNRLAAAASEANSPILLTVQMLDQHARIDRIYDRLDQMDREQLMQGGFGDAVFDRIWSRAGVFQRIALDYAVDSAKSDARVGGGGPSEQTAQGRAEALSRLHEGWYVLLRGDPPNRPIDVVLDNIANLRTVRRNAEYAPSQQDDRLVADALATLTAQNSSLPEPLAGWLNEIAFEFRRVTEDETLEQLNRALNEQVTRYCLENVGGHYPFSATDTEVNPRAFGDFFGDGGRMDQFYRNYLSRYVIRTPSGFQPDPRSTIGEQLSPETLELFRQAERIKEAFFASGSREPFVSFTVMHVASGQNVRGSIVEVNGERVELQSGGSGEALNWPGQGIGVAVQFDPIDFARESTARFNDRGRWSIVDFLRARNATTRVEGNVATVAFQLGGRSVTWRFEFDSVTVPFLMPELERFECPTRLN